MRTELYWIEGLWPGRLAILPRPRGGDWLDDEIQYWRAAGVDMLVSVLEQAEVEELALGDEAELSRTHGMEYVSFPIADRGVPSSTRSAAELVRRLENQLASGRSVAIHCRQGVGRSSLLAASLLVASGIESKTAFERIEVARGCSVPDTAEQREWVIRFARELMAAMAGKREERRL